MPSRHGAVAVLAGIRAGGDDPCVLPSHLTSSVSHQWIFDTSGEGTPDAGERSRPLTVAGAAQVGIARVGFLS